MTTRLHSIESSLSSKDFGLFRDGSTKKSFSARYSNKGLRDFQPKNLIFPFLPGSKEVCVQITEVAQVDINDKNTGCPKNILRF